MVSFSLQTTNQHTQNNEKKQQLKNANKHCLAVTRPIESSASPRSMLGASAGASFTRRGVAAARRGLRACARAPTPAVPWSSFRWSKRQHEEGLKFKE